MGGLLLLLALCVIMAMASFLAGALPLSMTLSQSQLRLISSIGIGILVGTSLIVIIPEGIEAVVTTGGTSHGHKTRSIESAAHLAVRREGLESSSIPGSSGIHAILDRRREQPDRLEALLQGREDAPADKAGEPSPEQHDDAEKHESGLPTFFIGLALILGFALMFLIDRLPQHATEKFQAAPATRHISLDNLTSSSMADDDETDDFLGSLTPTPKQSRSLATTTGLVIHAAADGIAMGASATTTDMKLGLIIFVAIMVHKAPAAFGLTSVLLKQGLSKRAARGHLIIFSLAAPFGALATYLIISLLGGNMDGPSGQWWTGMLLLFSAGTFLYVAMHAMEEDGASSGHDHHPGSNGYADGPSSQRKQSRPQMRDTLATVIGMLLPLLTQFGHHH